MFGVVLLYPRRSACTDLRRPITDREHTMSFRRESSWKVYHLGIFLSSSSGIPSTFGASPAFTLIVMACRPPRLKLAEFSGFH